MRGGATEGGQPQRGESAEKQIPPKPNIERYCVPLPISAMLCLVEAFPPIGLNPFGKRHIQMVCVSSAGVLSSSFPLRHPDGICISPHCTFMWWFFFFSHEELLRFAAKGQPQSVSPDGEPCFIPPGGFPQVGTSAFLCTFEACLPGSISRPTFWALRMPQRASESVSDAV